MSDPITIRQAQQPSVWATRRGTGATACALCDLPIDGEGVDDPLTGGRLHAACAADQASQEAVVALAEALALVVVPLVAVWAA